MKYIFVDFEMNPIERRYDDIRKQCAREIIEIGAVMLDKNFKEISSFKVYVKPEYNSIIYKKYQELTGISTNMVVRAEKFETVYRKFMNWCGNSDYKLYAWSNCDKEQIKREMKIKEFKIDSKVKYMFENWIDFQQMFGGILGAERLISLENALNYCGIPFLGNKHDALSDARNTSLLYKESKINDISKCIENVKKYRIGEGITLMLGELFNFASLNLQFA